MSKKYLRFVLDSIIVIVMSNFSVYFNNEETALIKRRAEEANYDSPNQFIHDSTLQAAVDPEQRVKKMLKMRNMVIDFFTVNI